MDKGRSQSQRAQPACEDVRMNTQSVLLAEYARLRNETFSVEGRYDRIVGVAVTLLTLIVLYGAHEERKEVFFALPFLIYGLVFYVLYFFHAMCVRAGYLRAIEEEINRLIGRNVLIWENHVVPSFLRFTRCPPALAFNGIVVFLVPAVVLYSHYVVLVNSSWSWLLVQIALSLVCVSGVVLVVKDIALVSRHCLDYSNSVFSKGEESGHGKEHSVSRNAV